MTAWLLVYWIATNAGAVTSGPDHLLFANRESCEATLESMRREARLETQARSTPLRGFCVIVEATTR